MSRARDLLVFADARAAVNIKQSQVAGSSKRRPHWSVEEGRKGESSCSARREETRRAIDDMIDDVDRLGIILRDFAISDQLRALCGFCASSATAFQH